MDDGGGGSGGEEYLQLLKQQSIRLTSAFMPTDGSPGCDDKQVHAAVRQHLTQTSAAPRGSAGNEAA